MMKVLAVSFVLLSAAGIAQAKNYIGLESSGVSHIGAYHEEAISWRGRFLLGHLNEPKSEVSNWRYGWESAAIYIAPGRTSYTKLSGFGADALFVANNNFCGAWEFFYKLGAGIDQITMKEHYYYYQSSFKESILYGVAKVGIGYQFKNGVGISLSENYQLPIGSYYASYGGFNRSLALTYRF
jgi:hypothetical protein